MGVARRVVVILGLRAVVTATQDERSQAVCGVTLVATREDLTIANTAASCRATAGSMGGASTSTAGLAIASATPCYTSTNAVGVDGGRMGVRRHSSRGIVGHRRRAAGIHFTIGGLPPPCSGGCA